MYEQRQVFTRASDLTLCPVPAAPAHGNPAERHSNAWEVRVKAESEGGQEC